MLVIKKLLAHDFHQPQGGAMEVLWFAKYHRDAKKTEITMFFGLSNKNYLCLKPVIDMMLNTLHSV